MAVDNSKAGYRVDDTVVREFNSRYSKGYMTAPRVLERRRIAEVITSLHLQEEGSALDFGCGMGEFTILLKELLPRWRIIGVDISDVAVDQAKKRYANLEFYTFGEFSAISQDLRPDFIFSHHVLEYIADLHYVFEQFNSLAKPHCAMLHIIPCNNGCGLEYAIASRVAGGINEKNGLYFFEHHAHVYRYSAKQFTQAAEQFGYSVGRIWYVDQFWGAIEWITRSSLSYIRRIAPLDVSVAGSKPKFFFLRLLLLTLFFVRYPGFNLSKAKRKRQWGLFRQAFYFCCLILYYPSLFLNRVLLRIVDVEWNSRKYDSCGGKMYLLLTR